jgi:hypothetical protein
MDMCIKAPRGMGQSYPIPFYPMGEGFSVKIPALLVYWGKNNFTDVDIPFGHSSEIIKETVVVYSLSAYAA